MTTMGQLEHQLAGYVARLKPPASQRAKAAL